MASEVLDSQAAECPPVLADLRDLRRELHAHPEVGLSLPWTQRRLLTELRPLGLEIALGDRLSSITAVIRGGRRAPGRSGRVPAVLVRSDMDALPVRERTGLPFAASGGAMHACGHDLHMAALVGAARLLAARRAELRGDVVLMFQPGEEDAGGALAMMAEGVLEAAGHTVDAVFGAHVVSHTLTPGVFYVSPGAVQAGSSTFRVAFLGRGGHGSSPWLEHSPIPPLAELVLALQAAITNSVDYRDDAVVTIGTIHAGEHQANVLPDRGELTGTARTFDPAVDERLEAVTRQVAAGVAAAHRVRAEVEWSGDSTPTVNDEGEAVFARRVAERELGAAVVAPLERPLTGSEDFARVLKRVPGVFVLVGAADIGLDPVSAPSNHSPLARFDDAVVAPLARLEAAWAQARLEALA